MASALHQRKTAVIEYRPVAVNGDHEWYWSLLPLPDETHALATGSAKNRGTAAMLARQEARKQGYLVSKVRIHHAMTENARRRILTVVKLRESEDDPDALNPHNELDRAFSSPLPGYRIVKRANQQPEEYDKWMVWKAEKDPRFPENEYYIGEVMYDAQKDVPDQWKEYKWHAALPAREGQYFKSFDEAVLFIVAEDKKKETNESENPDQFDPRRSAMCAFELPPPFKTNYVPWRGGGYWEIRIETVDKMYHEIVGTVQEYTDSEEIYRWGAVPNTLSRPVLFPTFDEAANYLMQRHKELTKHQRRYESDDPDALGPREMNHAFDWRAQIKAMGFEAHYNGTVETHYTLDSAPYRFIVRTTARRDNSLSVEAYIEGKDGFQPLFQEFVVPTMVQPVVRQLLQGKIDETEDPDTFDAKAQLMRGLDHKDFLDFLGTLHRGMSFEIFWRSEPLGRDLEEQSFQMEYTKAEGALTRADIGRVERSVKRYLVRHGWQIDHFFSDQTHESNARWISFGIKHVVTESDDPDAVDLHQHIPNALDWRKALMERGFNDLSTHAGYYVRCVGRHTLRVWPSKSMLTNGSELGKLSIQIFQEENGMDDFLRAEGVDPVDLGARLDQLIAEYSVLEEHDKAGNSSRTGQIQVVPHHSTR